MLYLLAGTANAPLRADGMASEVLQYPPKPLPPGACTCRLGWDKERLGMDCPSPWATPAGTSKVSSLRRARALHQQHSLM